MAIVLVVDDEPDIRDVLQLMLETAGYTVVQAGDGAEALARLAEHEPALILLDLNMPVMSGWDFHNALRMQRLRVPVVYMTAAAYAWVEAERHGADGCLAKPFNLDDVLDTVARFAV